MKIYGNRYKSMKINEKKQEINEIHEDVLDIFGLEKEDDILYSKHINASHICLPKRNKLLKQRK